MYTYLFTVTTEPDMSKPLCNLQHREIAVQAANEAIAWTIACELFSTARCPGLVGITLTNTIV